MAIHPARPSRRATNPGIPARFGRRSRTPSEPSASASSGPSRRVTVFLQPDRGDFDARIQHVHANGRITERPLRMLGTRAVVERKAIAAVEDFVRSGKALEGEVVLLPSRTDAGAAALGESARVIHTAQVSHFTVVNPGCRCGVRSPRR